MDLSVAQTVLKDFYYFSYYLGYIFKGVAYGAEKFASFLGLVSD